MAWKIPASIIFQSCRGMSDLQVRLYTKAKGELSWNAPLNIAPPSSVSKRSLSDNRARYNLGMKAQEPKVEVAATLERTVIRLPPPTWHLVLWLAIPVLAQQGLVFVVHQSDRYLAGHL